MTSEVRRRILVGGTAIVVAVLALFAIVQYRNAQARQEAVRQIGAEWQQEGLLSQQDYVKLRGIKVSVVQTRAISDQELDWLLARMAQSPSPIVHARVMGILSTLANATASQKVRINRAITPLLQSRNELQRRYALRVQRKLGLSH